MEMILVYAESLNRKIVLHKRSISEGNLGLSKETIFFTIIPKGFEALLDIEAISAGNLSCLGVCRIPFPINFVGFAEYKGGVLTVINPETDSQMTLPQDIGPFFIVPPQA